MPERVGLKEVRKAEITRKPPPAADRLTQQETERRDLRAADSEPRSRAESRTQEKAISRPKMREDVSRTRMPPADRVKMTKASSMLRTRVRMQKRVLFFTGFSSLENGSQEILLALFYSGGERRVTGNIYSPFPETHMLQLFCPAGVEGRQHAPVLQGGMAQDAAVAAVEGGVIPKACADGGFLGA